MAIQGGIARRYTAIAFDGNWVRCDGDVGVYHYVAIAPSTVFIDDMSAPWNGGPLPAGTIVTANTQSMTVAVIMR